MNIFLRAPATTGLLKKDLDYHLIRASMVVMKVARAAPLNRSVGSV